MLLIPILLLMGVDVSQKQISKSVLQSLHVYTYMFYVRSLMTKMEEFIYKKNTDKLMVARLKKKEALS